MKERFSRQPDNERLAALVAEGDVLLAKLQSKLGHQSEVE
jgi:hypothetical protein